MKPTIVNIKVPSSWNELDNEHLYYLYHLLADALSAAQIKTYCLFKWGKITIVCRYADGYLARRGKHEFYVTPEAVAAAIHALDFIDDVPDQPVRITQIKGHDAVDALMVGVPFEVYLYIENLYQGFLHTQNHGLLVDMGHMLYECSELQMNQAEKMSVFYWWTALKKYLAREFPHFFSVAPTSETLQTKPVGRQLKEAMDVQIRALTKGDITKEKEILAMDTWRALTELDAQAREAEEIERKYGKS